MGADCKSVGLRLPRFESWICHQGQAVSGPAATVFSCGPVRSKSGAVDKSVWNSSSVDAGAAGQEYMFTKRVDEQIAFVSQL
jgi:hypothetical protein